MGVLTYLVEATIRDAKDRYEGKTLTRPLLLVSDSRNTTYGVNVDIGHDTPLYNVPIAKGNKDLIYAEVGSAVTVTRSASGQFEVTGFAKRMPGSRYAVGVRLPDLSYTPQAIYRYTGSAGGEAMTERHAPGGVIVGPLLPAGLATRILSYGELAEHGGYGAVPYGAVARYLDGEFDGFM